MSLTDTQSLNASSLSGWEGGPCPRSSLNATALQKVENTTHGSGWIVQIFSTSKAARGVCANPTNGSWWIVQILSTSIWERKCSRKIILSLPLETN